MEDQMLALALRSTLYTPSEILEFSGLVESSRRVRTLFFPDITGSYDSIELSMAGLAVTHNIRVGTGVLRPLEQNVDLLTRRIGTLQFLSGNRFILGVGTGRPTANPAETIGKVLEVVRQVRDRFERLFKDRQLEMPEVYMAALKPGIAKRTIEHVDGLILNFCSARYSTELVKKVRSKIGPKKLSDKTVACYIKIFYSADANVARELLVSEFKHYNDNPQYHEMFMKEGIADDIVNAWNLHTDKKLQEIPRSLARVSLANPTVADLTHLINEFRSSGVNLPCLYPYFAETDDTAFKLGVIEEIIDVE